MKIEEITAILGPTDPTLIAEINQTGASSTELAEALAWFNADETLVSEERSPPSGRVAEIVSLLEANQIFREDR